MVPAPEAQAWGDGADGACVPAPGIQEHFLLWPVGCGRRDTPATEPTAFLLSFRNVLCWGQMCGAQTLELGGGAVPETEPGGAAVPDQHWTGVRARLGCSSPAGI